jgi:hypothetical protein
MIVLLVNIMKQGGGIISCARDANLPESVRSKTEQETRTKKADSVYLGLSLQEFSNTNIYPHLFEVISSGILQLLVN